MTHTAAHFDEQWATYQLQSWGEHVHPGISKKPTIVCLLDSDNITWQELLELGLVPVGIGGKDNPYDEHGRVNAQGDSLYTCAAELVTCGYIPGKKEVEAQRAYLSDPTKRGLGLLNRHKFFRTLDPDPDVYIHAISSITNYALQVDRNRVNDIHAAPNDIKTDWAVWEDLIKGKLSLPSDLKVPAAYLPSDARAAMNKVAKSVFENAFYNFWLYLAEGIAFARSIKRAVKNKVERRKNYIAGIKPPIRIYIVRPDHPLADDRNIAKVLRYLGADVVCVFNTKGHLFINVRDFVWKLEDEEEMDKNPEVEYKDEEDRKRTRIKIQLGLRTLLIALRRAELEERGDVTKYTDEQLAKPSFEGSLVGTPTLKAGYLYVGGTTQSKQEGQRWPISVENTLDIIETSLEGKIIERSDRTVGTPGKSRRERLAEEETIVVEPDESGQVRAASC